VALVCALRSGGAAWIERRGVSSGSAGPLSCGSPTTSRSRPRTASPTGTVTDCAAGANRNATGKARGGLERHSAYCLLIEVAVNFENEGSWPVPFHDEAELIGGRSGPAKTTSTTAPLTACTTPSRGKPQSSTCAPFPTRVVSIFGVGSERLGVKRGLFAFLSRATSQKTAACWEHLKEE
jgi:hypothetical protein